MTIGVTFTGRRCVFCGSTGDLTREHVLRDKFNVLFDGTHHERRITNFVGGDPVPTSDRRFVEKPYGQKVRQVCAACNNGWMNDLENGVEAELVALMRGENVAFPMPARERLARWAAKTALIRQLLSDPSAVVRESHVFTEVMNGHPPLWSWLFAGRMNRTPYGPLTRSTLLHFGDDVDEWHALISTTHIEELLLVSVIPLNVYGGRRINHQLAWYEVPGMTPIFPSRRLIDWSTQTILDPALFPRVTETYASILVQPDPGRLPPEPPAQDLHHD